MTVAKLIAALQAMPQDAEVETVGCSGLLQNVTPVEGIDTKGKPRTHVALCACSR